MSFWFFLFSFYWNAVLGGKDKHKFCLLSKTNSTLGLHRDAGSPFVLCVEIVAHKLFAILLSPHSSLMLCKFVCKLAEPNKVKQHLLHSTLRRNHSCSVSCMEPQTTWQVFLPTPQSQLRGKCWGKLLLGDRDQVYMNRNTNTHRHKHTENFNVEVISALSVWRSNLKCFHKI